MSTKDRKNICLHGFNTMDCKYGCAVRKIEEMITDISHRPTHLPEKKKVFYSYYVPRCRYCSESSADSSECFSGCGYWKKVDKISEIPEELRKSKQYRTHIK